MCKRGETAALTPITLSASPNSLSSSAVRGFCGSDAKLRGRGRTRGQRPARTHGLPDHLRALELDLGTELDDSIIQQEGTKGSELISLDFDGF